MRSHSAAMPDIASRRVPKWVGCADMLDLSGLRDPHGSLARRAMVAFLAALTVLAMWTSNAHAAVVDCNATNNSHPGFNIVVVTSARNIGCREALRQVNKYRPTPSRNAWQSGSRFRLGPWSCKTMYVNEQTGELARARCTRGGQAFRIEYGS